MHFGAGYLQDCHRRRQGASSCAGAGGVVRGSMHHQ